MTAWSGLHHSFSISHFLGGKRVHGLLVLSCAVFVPLIASCPRSKKTSRAVLGADTVEENLQISCVDDLNTAQTTESPPSLHPTKERFLRRFSLRENLPYKSVADMIALRKLRQSVNRCGACTSVTVRNNISLLVMAVSVASYCKSRMHLL